jgi:hypothetical protein
MSKNPREKKLEYVRSVNSGGSAPSSQPAPQITSSAPTSASQGPEKEVAEIKAELEELEKQVAGAIKEDQRYVAVMVTQTRGHLVALRQLERKKKTLKADDLSSVRSSFNAAKERVKEVLLRMQKQKDEKEKEQEQEKQAAAARRPAELKILQQKLDGLRQRDLTCATKDDLQEIEEAISKAEKAHETAREATEGSTQGVASAIEKADKVVSAVQSRLRPLRRSKRYVEVNQANAQKLLKQAGAFASDQGFQLPGTLDDLNNNLKKAIKQEDWPAAEKALDDLSDQAMELLSVRNQMGDVNDGIGQLQNQKDAVQVQQELAKVRAELRKPDFAAARQALTDCITLLTGFANTPPPQVAVIPQGTQVKDEGTNKPYILAGRKVYLKPEMIENLAGRHDVPLDVICAAAKNAMNRKSDDDGRGGYFYRVGAADSQKFVVLVLDGDWMTTCYSSNQAQIMTKMGFKRDEEIRFNFVMQNRMRLPNW